MSQLIACGGCGQPVAPLATCPRCGTRAGWAPTGEKRVRNDRTMLFGFALLVAIVVASVVIHLSS